MFNDNSLFPTIPRKLLEEWFDDFCEIEFKRMSTSELLKMEEDETYGDGRMTELLGRWIISMKDSGFE